MLDHGSQSLTTQQSADVDLIDAFIAVGDSNIVNSTGDKNVDKHNSADDNGINKTSSTEDNNEEYCRGV
ncbi:unnamed protein product [Anisakis simplex]|uniref:Uncharacterized protein n=1 Tax=Anisakis simplex TaxID=6269 RepID=A0A0M3JA53_ANISI|nr:unnamed protein product [Anisakis simplex]